MSPSCLQDWHLAGGWAPAKSASPSFMRRQRLGNERQRSPCDSPPSSGGYDGRRRSAKRLEHLQGRLQRLGAHSCAAKRPQSAHAIAVPSSEHLDNGAGVRRPLSAYSWRSRCEALPAAAWHDMIDLCGDTNACTTHVWARFCHLLMMRYAFGAATGPFDSADPDRRAQGCTTW